MAELPSGTVTFLFTDIEGSTRLWEEHSDAMRDALARHDEILHDAVKSHGGHVVKGLGDGVFAVFAAAHDGWRPRWTVSGHSKLSLGVRSSGCACGLVCIRRRLNIVTATTTVLH